MNGMGGRVNGEDMEDGSIEDSLSARIRSAISDGRLPPGTKLPEELLAEQWTVNRARIRTVLQRLAFEDLVELKRNRGAFVSTPGNKEARDVFEARRVIERVTTEIVTRTILTPQLNALKAQLDDRERTWVHGNRQQAIASISAFHRSLAALAHNESLAQALERLILRSALILGLYGTTDTFARASAHYGTLLAEIDRGESIVAARTMERCLFTLEKGLDLRPATAHDIDLARVVGRSG
jgi:DNA-binding GntR family transcriptional regulator